MRIFSSRLIWGLLLIGAGTLFLLQNLNVLPPSPSLWGTAALLGGVFFLLGYLVNRAYWWAAFPAFALLGVALLTFWDWLPIRQESAEFQGGAFLGMLGLSFIAVYLRQPKHWWALIPAGVLFSMASMAVLQALVENPGIVEMGGVLFIGMGITFFLIFILPGAEGRRGWALWPAMSLLLFGGLILAAATDLLGLLWPVALILAGLLVILRGFRR
ncbi:MAG: hypothetical protein Fur0022_26550 [Anaerolineales bacterium]